MHAVQKKNQQQKQNLKKSIDRQIEEHIPAGLLLYVPVCIVYSDLLPMSRSLNARYVIFPGSFAIAAEMSFRAPCESPEKAFAYDER